MIKTLAGQVKEFKKDSIITPIFMILEVIMEMIIPLLMSSIIDDGVEKGDIHHIYIIGIWMVVAAGIGLFAGIMGGKYGARASTGFARNLRQAMFENIQTFSFSNIDKFSTPSLVTRMTTDVTNLQNSYQMLLRMCNDYVIFGECKARKYLSGCGYYSWCASCNYYLEGNGIFYSNV